MKTKTFVWIGIIGAIAIFFISSYASFNNRDVDLTTTFDENMKNNKAFYAKFKAVISGKAQIAKVYDSSFIRVVNASMDPRKDGAGLMMKWVQESNPTLQIGTVQELYKDLGRTIESERTSFFERQTTLSSIQQQHRKFLRSFPNNLINVFMNRQEIVFNPITSDETEKVFESGRDNDTKVF